jgi:hypothetical protein
MTGADIMAVVGFFIVVAGFLFGLWKYIDAKLTAVRAEASQKADAAAALANMARAELSAYQTKVAETYVTKQGMHEQTEHLLRAIESIGTRIDSLTSRIDNLIKPRSTRS